MCSYLSKQEDECSQAMKQALKESYEQIKSLAHAYSSKRECSLQGAVYQVIPELWLRKVFQECYMQTVIFHKSMLE